MALVLCLDDDEMVAKMVAEIVRFHKHQPTIETSSLDAIAKWIGDRRLAAVITDYMMPRMDGLEILTVFQEQRPEVRRVLLTAAPGEKPVRDASNSGLAQMVIAKPPSLADVKMALAWL